MSLTTAGLNFLAQAVIGQGVPFNATNTCLGVGNGGAAFSAAQDDLQGASKVRKALDAGYPVANPPRVTFKATFGPDEANFPWNEWGLFNAASGGVMLNRAVESNGTKLDNQTWILEVDIQFALSN